MLVIDLGLLNRQATATTYKKADHLERGVGITACFGGGVFSPSVPTKKLGVSHQLHHRTFSISR